MDNHYVLAIDKHHDHVIPHLKEPTLVVHGVNEPKEKYTDFYNSCKRIIVSRVPIRTFLKEKCGVDAELKPLPFFPYPLKNTKSPTDVVSMSRVEYRKGQEMICRANKMLDKPIKIYGQVNRIYEYQFLKDLDFKKYYVGEYPQEFEVHEQILSKAKFLVNLTQVPKDGGNMEYTMLQAAYQDVPIIIHTSWLDAEGSIFKKDFDCLVVDNEQELADLIKNEKNIDQAKIAANAKKHLQRHIEACWL